MFDDICIYYIFSFDGLTQGLVSRPVKQNPEIKFEIINSVSNPDGYASGHGYLDLGLPSGTKWATANISSVTPYEFDLYVRWGSLQWKTSFEDNLKYGERMKNVNYSIAGNFKYDIASKSWGRKWCMPTSEQLQELVWSRTI